MPNKTASVVVLINAVPLVSEPVAAEKIPGWSATPLAELADPELAVVVVQSLEIVADINS